MCTLCIVDCVCTMYIAECMCTMHNESMCTMYIMRSVRPYIIVICKIIWV